MSRRVTLVAGASGLVGRAAFAHLAQRNEFVFGLSRRAPDLDIGTHVPIDLLDPVATRAALAKRPAVTHVVYAALQEKLGLVAGWFDPETMETNRRMLETLLDAVEAGGALEHVSLLQGTKAYGAHVGGMRVPGRERDPRHRHDNFYWLQEDLLRERASRAGYAWTIWRPPVVYGHALGAPMNPLAPLVTFAALEREAGRPLRWPGGRTGPVEGVDARLLARAIDWGMSDERARNQIFNVANGDVFVWENVWPRVAEAFGMRVGEPAPVRLAEAMPPRAHEWANVVHRYGLRAPGLMDFVGDAFVYADLQWGHGRDEAAPSHLLSTIKLRQAGFAECIDSEEMLVQWIEWMQRERLIPAP